MEQGSVNGEFDKVCTKCGEAKPLGQFVNNGIMSDKKHPFCNPCRKAALSAGWATRKLAKEAGAGFDPGKVENDSGITREEWWEMFDFVISGCAQRAKEIEAIYGTGSAEARKRRFKLKTAVERLHSAVVAMWGSPRP
jgi:hypothetical protein